MNYDIRKTTAVFFVIRGITSLISFISLPVSVKYFGINVDRDIWLLANAFLGTVSSVFWGPINSIFRTRFVFLKETKGEKEAFEKFKSLIIFLFFSIVFLSVIILIFPVQIKSFVAPVIEGEAEKSFIKILQIMVPTLLINQFTYIGMSVLNTFNVFYIPEIVGGISSVINIFCLIFFAPRIGIYSLIVSTYISSMILLTAICFFFYKKNICIWKGPLKFSWESVWIFLSFASPFYLCYFIGQVCGLLERSLSNLLGTGVISIIDYSRRFPGLVQSVLTTVTESAMMPALTSAFLKKDGNIFFTEFRNSLQIVLIIMSLAVSYLVGAADPVCRFFFFRGSMTMESVHDIVMLTRFYTIALAAIVLYMILNLGVLAQQRNKLFVFFGVSVQIIMIVLNLVLYKYLKIYTFSITTFIAHLIICFFLFKTILTKNKRLLFIEIAKYAVITLFLSILLTVINNSLLEMPSLLKMTLNGAVLFFVFAIIMHYFMKVNLLLIIKGALKR